MNSLIERLLGIDPASWAEGGDWHVEFLSLPSGDWALAGMVGVAFVCGAMLYLYRREGRHLSRLTCIVLGLLRVTALLCVAFMMMEPVLVFTKKEHLPSHLPVLVDTSKSMGLTDAHVDEKRAAQQAEALGLDGGVAELRKRARLSIGQQILSRPMLEALSANGDRVVAPFAFSDQLFPVEEGGITGLVANGTLTGIGTAVREVLLRYRGSPLAGVLVVTDGQSNAGEPVDVAAVAAAAEGVQVSVLALGTPDGPRNASVLELETSPVVFVRDPIPLSALILSRGLAGTERTVSLERRRRNGHWELVSEKEVMLGANGEILRVPFEDTERRPATLQYRVHLEALPGELSAEDNIASATVKVVRRKIRVLMVAGSTFPEVQFLRNTLLRDEHIDLSSWLMSADEDYEHPGDRPIRRLPVTQEELDDYDCVVLYDPDPSAWPPNWPTLLTHFVGQAGGGLIYIAGERMTKQLFDRQGEPALSWLRLLPVVREPGLFRTEVAVRLSSKKEWKLDITAEGESSPTLRFDEDPETNQRTLSRLPGMYWHFPVTRAKPGATVLARHGDPRMRNQFGRHVLLATQLYGPGRTFFLAFDSSYRWRYLGEQHFDQFWARLADRAGRGKQLGGRFPYVVSTSRAAYGPGDEVNVRVQFSDEAWSGTVSEALHGDVEVGLDSGAPLEFHPDETQPGVFRAVFRADRTGVHRIRVWTGAEELAPDTRVATHEVTVSEPRLEFERAGLDLEQCERLARLSGGRVFDLLTAKAIPEAFRIRRVERTLQDPQEIWDAPLLLGLVLFLVFTEWLVRKLVRLV